MMSRLDEVHVCCGACWVIFLKPDRLVAVDCFSSPLLWRWKISLHLLLLLPPHWLVVRSSCTAQKAGGRGATAGAAAGAGRGPSCSSSSAPNTPELSRVRGVAGRGAAAPSRSLVGAVPSSGPDCSFKCSEGMITVSAPDAM